MKKQFRPLLTLAFMLLMSFAATAQVGRIEQTTIEYEDARVDALAVTMKPERKEVQKAFDDWMKDRYDVKMKGGGLFGDKNFEMAEAIVIPAISSENISLMTQTEERNGETVMTLFASKGLGNYVEDSDYKAFSGLEDVFDAFLSNYLPEYYEERVAEAREMLEDYQKDYDKAQEDVTDNEEEIRDLQQENEELRTEMKQLQEKIAEAEKTLNMRRDIRREVDREVVGRRN
ncbi:MAG: hypothetical protein AAFN92_08285 [Bacteroidota bacterium]